MTTKRLDEPQPDTEEPRRRSRFHSRQPALDEDVLKSSFWQAFSGLKDGSKGVSEALGIIRELDTTRDMTRYDREVLAMRTAFRDELPATAYNEDIASFLGRAAEIIPSLNEPLADILVFALSEAAKNDEYLECVESALEKPLEGFGFDSHRRVPLQQLLHQVLQRRKELSEPRYEPRIDEPAQSIPDITQRPMTILPSAIGAGKNNDERRISGRRVWPWVAAGVAAALGIAAAYLLDDGGTKDDPSAAKPALSAGGQKITAGQAP